MSDGPNIGDLVILYPLTDGREGGNGANPVLWGARARVLELAPWGARVRYATGTERVGVLRVGFDEMVPADDGVLDRPPVADLPVRHEASAGGRANGVARRRPSGQPTGDLCGACGSANMTRDGTCMVCLDCGDRAGGCG